MQKKKEKKKASVCVFSLNVTILSCVCFLCRLAKGCPRAACRTLPAAGQQAQEERARKEGEEERKAQEENGRRGTCGGTSVCDAPDLQEKQKQQRADHCKEGQEEARVGFFCRSKKIK